jgi:hypothetical protein
MQPINKVYELPKFDEVIKIEVEASLIFDKLHATLGGFKHADILAHAIVGNALDKGGIVYIYNALNGMDNFIDFNVGDTIYCKDIDRNERYDSRQETEDGQSIPDAPDPTMDEYLPKFAYRKVEIGKCKVIGVSLYTTNKLKVEFMGYNSYGRDRDTETLQTEAVNHKNCSKVVILA